MENPLCPRCRTPLPVDALAGLCPACMFEQGAFDSQSDISASAFIPPSIDELAPLFPALEIQELIGRGGMGAVYKARQIELDRVVALKILPSDIARDPAFSERFSREARALAKLNHPGIVALFEFGRSGDLFFFLMEFVDGVTLRQLLLGERLSAREALAIVPRICDALQYAHDRGIVHRDIKPENILLDRQGNVKIADFGLVKLVDPGCASEDTTAGEIPSASRLKALIPVHTEAGKLMGTPAYMAPEQIDHPSGVDHRADIYALGVIFYQMLTGELPDKPLAPPSSHVLIDVRLDEVVIRALQQNPSLRFQQASDLKTRVEEITRSLVPSPTVERKRPWLRICGALLILCLPLSLAVPVFLLHLQPEKTHLSSSFFVPNETSRDETLATLKQALVPFPDVTLSLDLSEREWRLRLSGSDKKRADARMNEAQAAITGALEMKNKDPLSESIRFNSYGSSTGNMANWSKNSAYIIRLRNSLFTGILLSAAGLLCLSLPRSPQAPPVAWWPGMISLGFFLFGSWTVYFVIHSAAPLSSVSVIAAAVLGGVPAMLFGLSARSRRIGRLVAASSWCGILGLSVFVCLPTWSYNNFGWRDIERPPGIVAPAPALPATGRSTEKANDAKKAAVISWLESIDSGKYSEAWELNSKLTRTLESEESWTTKLKAAREPLGGLLSRKIEKIRSDAHVEGLPFGEYMAYTFRSDFASKPSVVESVTLIRQDGGKWRILAYTIK